MSGNLGILGGAGGIGRVLVREAREAGYTPIVFDLARSIAPNLPHKIIGIRPGEKLHEVMVPADDSRSTVELDDRYVILPHGADRLRADWFVAGAKPVPEGFEYQSDSNPERLDARALQSLLNLKISKEAQA